MNKWTVTRVGTNSRERSEVKMCFPFFRTISASTKIVRRGGWVWRSRVGGENQRRGGGVGILPRMFIMVFDHIRFPCMKIRAKE